MHVREGRPSITAALVSFARGVGVQEPIPDPLAGELIPGPLGAALRSVRDSQRMRPFGRTFLRYASLGLVDHVSLRTIAIDAFVADAVDQGIDQCVILGAGLDARAYRLSALAGKKVFEVDHPSTQRFKRSRSRRLPAPVAELVYVSVDFGREALDDRLVEAGFDPSARTLFLWEGVTMYLTPEAVDETLSRLSRLAAPGSMLATTYSIPNPLGSASGEFAKKLLFGAVFGEPMIGEFTSDAIRSMLEAHGFRVVRDDHDDAWARAASIDGHITKLFQGERLVVARKD
jgi:methyltransferase (TIGR00027 family)